jgi:hypothetical protein
MGYVIFWFLCAIFSAALASSKNRSAFGWFVLGLIVGPFGLLVAFFPKLDVPPSASGDATVSETRSCPYCAETIKRAAKVCRFCNRELPEIKDTEFVSASEYAAARNIAESSVVAKLRDGDLLGRQVDGIWYVNKNELGA